MKKAALLLALLMVFCLCTSLVGCGNGKEDGAAKIVKEGIFEFELVDGTYTVKCIHRMEDDTQKNPEVFEAEIPSTVNGKPVTTIGEKAFNNCQGMTKVVIPDSITRIEDWAFFGCENLESIQIPNSVTYIGINICSWVGDQAFTEYGNCYYLGNENNPYLYLDHSKFEADYYEIHKDTRILGSSAFYLNENIRMIVIPASVKQICANAFYWCEYLKTIYFEGTKAQWESIEFGRAWKDRVPAKYVSCSDGDIDF